MAEGEGREPAPQVERWTDQLSRFWSHPVVQIGQWVVALILGGLIGYVVAIWAEKTRELRYTVSPVRTSIVKAGATSALEVSHGGQPVKTDVSAVQVQVWNQGREAIVQQDMLEPLVLSTADQTPILEATVRQQKRPVVNLQLVDAERQSGRVKVSWNILEQEDGGIIQLVIAGKPDVKVTAAGTVRGQRPVREVASLSGRTQIWPGRAIGLALALFAIIGLILLALTVLGMFGPSSWPTSLIGFDPQEVLLLAPRLKGLFFFLLGSLTIGVAILGWSLYPVLSARLGPTPPLPF